MMTAAGMRRKRTRTVPVEYRGRSQDEMAAKMGMLSNERKPV
jgi:hypothetical protein